MELFASSGAIPDEATGWPVQMQAPIENRVLSRGIVPADARNYSAKYPKREAGYFDETEKAHRKGARHFHLE
jgi:hypothetical protein